MAGRTMAEVYDDLNRDKSTDSGGSVTPEFKIDSRILDGAVLPRTLDELLLASSIGGLSLPLLGRNMADSRDAAQQRRFFDAADLLGAQDEFNRLAESFRVERENRANTAQAGALSTDRYSDAINDRIRQFNDSTAPRLSELHAAIRAMEEGRAGNPGYANPLDFSNSTFSPETTADPGLAAQRVAYFLSDPAGAQESYRQFRAQLSDTDAGMPNRLSVGQNNRVNPPANAAGVNSSALNAFDDAWRSSAEAAAFWRLFGESDPVINGRTPGIHWRPGVAERFAVDGTPTSEQIMGTRTDGRGRHSRTSPVNPHAAESAARFFGFDPMQAVSPGDYTVTPTLASARNIAPSRWGIDNASNPNRYGLPPQDEGWRRRAVRELFGRTDTRYGGTADSLRASGEDVRSRRTRRLGTPAVPRYVSIPVGILGALGAADLAFGTAPNLFAPTSVPDLRYEE